MGHFTGCSRVLTGNGKVTLAGFPEHSKFGDLCLDGHRCFKETFRCSDVKVIYQSQRLSEFKFKIG